MKKHMFLQKDSKDRRNLPIGIFDSGLGGLTVVKEVLNFLPHESVIYLGDTARLPYGNKSEDTVLRFTKEAISFFSSKDVKILLVACNTASSLALPKLDDDYNFPIYGVIDAGVEEASKVTRVNRVGVVGTKATIQSGIYEKKLRKSSSNMEVYSKACPLFVPLIEEGWMEDSIAYKVSEKYLKDFKKEKIDVLILGCTHYPLMKTVIKYAVGDNVALIDSARSFAKKIKEFLSEQNLSADTAQSNCEFYVTDEPRLFRERSSLFLEKDIDFVTKINLEDYK
ncbi:MAG: glutamate racemase [Candidatus Saelkia tenebricola]|nr:glutamate racemase [Candidatus Saelkia tenebricola]